MKTGPGRQAAVDAGPGRDDFHQMFVMERPASSGKIWKPSKPSWKRSNRSWIASGTSWRAPTWRWTTPRSASWHTATAGNNWKPLPRKPGPRWRNGSSCCTAPTPIAAFAADMSEFLKTSELTETKAFVRSFVREVLVRLGGATIVYTIPTPETVQ